MRLPAHHLIKPITALAAAAAVMLGCQMQDTTDQVRLLWTNDTHGYFMPVYHYERDELDRFSGPMATEGTVGGYARIKTKVDQLRAQRENVLFLDSGDTFDGSPVAQLTKGEDVTPVLNAMGYDAMTPGNRDFAFGKAEFMRVTGLLNFPVISATLYHQPTATQALEPVFDKYIIKNFPETGIKVAVVGLSHILNTVGFVTSSLHQAPDKNVKGFEVEQEVTDLVAQIRATENPDLVVAISHFGMLQDFEFATRQAGIDVILGGHSHDNIKEARQFRDRDGRNVIVAQAGSHGKYLGKLDVRVSSGPSGKSVSLAGRNGPINSAYELVRMTRFIAEDPLVKAVADAQYAKHAAYLDREIGQLQSPIPLARRGETESNMANFVTDAYATMKSADVSRFLGIRYGSSVKPGPITVGDVWNMVSPNWGGRKIHYGDITGDYVKEELNIRLNSQFNADQNPYGWFGGDVTRFNGNVRYTYKSGSGVPPNERIVDLQIGADYLIQGGVDVPENLAKTYTYAASLPPKAGYPTVKPILPSDSVEELVAYIESLPNRTIDYGVTGGFDGRACPVDKAVSHCP